jgi:hypothetical protein
VGLCGQAPSPEFTQFLVEEGIDSISFNPDALIKGIENILATEKKKMNKKKKNYGNSIQKKSSDYYRRIFRYRKSHCIGFQKRKNCYCRLGMKARNYAESYRLRRGSYFIKCDVSKSADVKPWSKNHSYFGRLDYANNAGIEGFCSHG